MAELTSFGYRSGTSVLHALDVRFKLVFLIVFSIVCIHLDFLALGTLSLLVIYLFIPSRMPLKSIFKELRYFFIILLVVFVARVLTTDGVPALDIRVLVISRQGLYQGTLICWRLVVIVLFGVLFVATTRASEIKSAIEWFLKPIPFVAEKRVATMLSLIMRFLPVIVYQARETAEAQKARGVENRKNPIYRITKLAIPILRRMFENADKLIVAMEARCFCEMRTDPELSCNPKDWFMFLFVIAFCVLLLIINFYELDPFFHRFA
ncbi:MAG: energy-coupling factor transporter transmembrane protein EcfT [Desulfobacterales bacterium]|nr:MAG: energy-coupling factor transporter transmembrane protein EcfT [Desulfobacterales bacterium]